MLLANLLACFGGVRACVVGLTVNAGVSALPDSADPLGGGEPKENAAPPVELLLACLLSYYGTTVLRSALQEAWAPTLELWREYRLDYEAAIEISPELEDDIVSDYLRRFAHIYAEQMLETITL